MRAIAVLLLLLTSACANYRFFMPRENTNGTGPDGHPAAVYAIGPVPAHGEVRVWSRGARMVDEGDEDAVELRVGFEIENTGSEVLAIDPAAVQCAEVRVDGTRVEALAPFSYEGDTEAAPGTTSRLVMVFRPEPARRPRDLDGFTIRFQVLAAGQPVLAQATPFVPYVRDDWRYHDHWYWGHHHHWHHWGPGFGFGFHHHHW